MSIRAGAARVVRLLRVVVAAAFVLVLVLLGWVGWGRAPAPWQVATGWDDLPATDRPAGAVLSELDWGAAGAPRIDWLGHSGFLLRWGGTSLLLDPNTSARCTISPRLLERPADVDELGPIDGVLISHAHYDHLDMPTLERVRSIGTLVLPEGSEAFLSREGRRDTALAPLRPGGSVRIGGLRVVAVRAEHNGNRFHPLKSRHGALGYIVRRADRTIYYSGDTGSTLDFERIGTEYGPLLAILPIGAYAPTFPMKYYHLSPEEAVEAALALGVDAVIPCHFGTFVLSLDRPSSALPRFARAARAHHLRWAMPALLGASGATSPVADVASREQR